MTKRRLEARPLSQVEMRPVEWTWEGWVPSRHLCLLSGESGLGKSTLLAYVAAQASRGTLPGALMGRPSDVLWISYEDTAEEVLKPRLAAAGADLERVHVVVAHVGDVEDLVSLSEDNDELTRLARDLGVRLVIVDPILSGMTGNVDTHKTHDVRRELAPLQKMAEALDLAVVAVLHFKKGEEPNPLARVEASGAFTQVARSTVIFGVDPNGDGGRDGPDRVLVHAKANLSPLHHAEAFAIESVRVGDRGEIQTTRLIPKGRSTVTGEDLSQPASKEQRTEGARAKQFILEALEDGAHKADELRERAKAEGLAEKTFSMARTALRESGSIVRAKDGKGPWVWSLAKKAKLQPHREDSRLCHLGDLEEARFVELEKTAAAMGVL